jgi:hypothetical protein
MRRALVVPITLLALSCDEPPELGDDLEMWTLRRDPLVQIGVPDGDERYLLHNVQDVATFSDGRIAVANGGSQDIRIYGPDGAHLLTIGRAGDGPGEFRSLASVDVTAADSIIAFDSGLRRVSVFDGSGVYARSWSFESPGRGIYPSKARAFDDGTVLVAFLRGRMPGDPPGLFRELAPVVRYSPDGEKLGAIAQLPGEEWYYSEDQGILIALPLGRGSHFAATRNHVYIGDGNDLIAYRAAGDSLHALRPFEARPVSQEDIDGDSNRRLARMPSEAHPKYHAVFAELPYPDTLPRYSRIVGGDRDNVWVERYRVSPDQPSSWQMLEPSGEPIASLELPGGYSPYRVNGNTVIGVMRDSANVEYVVAHEVARRCEGSV